MGTTDQQQHTLDSKDSTCPQNQDQYHHCTRAKHTDPLHFLLEKQRSSMETLDGSLFPDHQSLSAQGLRVPSTLRTCPSPCSSISISPSTSTSQGDMASVASLDDTPLLSSGTLDLLEDRASLPRSQAAAHNTDIPNGPLSHLPRMHTGRLKLSTDKLFEWAKTTAEDLAAVGHDAGGSYGLSSPYRGCRQVPEVHQDELSSPSPDPTLFLSHSAIARFDGSGIEGMTSDSMHINHVGLFNSTSPLSTAQEPTPESDNTELHYEAVTPPTSAKDSPFGSDMLLFKRSMVEMEKNLPELICMALDQHRSILATAMSVYDISIRFTEINQLLLDKVAQTNSLQDKCRESLETLAQLRFEHRFRRQELGQLGIPSNMTDILSDLTSQFHDCTVIEQAFSDTKEEYEMTLAQLDYHGLIDPHTLPISSTDNISKLEMDLVEASKRPLVQWPKESDAEFSLRKKYTRLTYTVRLNEDRLRKLHETLRQQLPRNDTILAVLPLLGVIGQRYTMWTLSAQTLTSNVNSELKRIMLLKSRQPTNTRSFKRRATFPSCDRVSLSTDFLDQLKASTLNPSFTSTVDREAFSDVSETYGAPSVPSHTIRRSLLLTHPQSVSPSTKTALLIHTSSESLSSASS
ncbi:hypothetical protein BASA62_003849 [Batrachochytrium salamandrivorans]|nr:hypothetical protein BASA62_003849 [Batrachochytrium salamandrivorans]